VLGASRGAAQARPITGMPHAGADGAKLTPDG